MRGDGVDEVVIKLNHISLRQNFDCGDIISCCPVVSIGNQIAVAYRSEYQANFSGVAPLKGACLHEALARGDTIKSTHSLEAGHCLEASFQEQILLFEDTPARSWTNCYSNCPGIKQPSREGPSRRRLLASLHIFLTHFRKSGERNVPRSKS